MLTEERFFQGANIYLENVARSIPLPVLRKDFLIDSYQVYEARCLGASAFLLIVDCLEPDDLRQLIALGKDLGMGIGSFVMAGSGDMMVKMIWQESLLWLKSDIQPT